MEGAIDIKPEGVSGHTTVPDDLSSGPGLREGLSGSSCLGDLVENFVFFTPALLFTHGELDKDPVQEFMNLAEGEPQIALMSFNRPVFEGMRFKDGRTDWNHKLIGIEKARWPDMLKYMSEIGILDSRTKLFYQAVPSELLIADPVLADRVCLPTNVATIPIVVFTLDGNTRRVVVETRGPGRIPWVTIKKPDPERVAAVRKMFDYLEKAG